MTVMDRNDIIIIGCGPGSKDFLTLRALKVAEKAEILVGPERFLNLFPELECEKVYFKGNHEEILDIVERSWPVKRVVILVSGDPGIHSFARKVMERFGTHQCHIIPGISSIQYAFNRLGIAWDNCLILSCHGKDIKGLAEKVKNHSKVVILTGGEEDPKKIALSLENEDIPYKSIYLCENLSMEDERIRKLSLDELKQANAYSRYPRDSEIAQVEGDIARLKKENESNPPSPSSPRQ
jgi:precorrin-6y C5,15-methyltransferase (decarboxylating) CbiE subunit